MPDAIDTVVTHQKVSWVSFCCMESGRTPTTTPALKELAIRQNTLHENAMLIDEANGRFGQAAEGGGYIKNTKILANQRRLTPKSRKPVHNAHSVVSLVDNGCSIDSWSVYEVVCVMMTAH